MSAEFSTTTFGFHIATGHGMTPAGDVHQPQWGPWMREHDMWMRQCLWTPDGTVVNICDVDEYSKEKPK